LAEGLAAESYLDTDNRRFFVNNGGAIDLHPTLLGQDRAGASCAPFTVDPATVEPLWRRLAERATLLGQAPAAIGSATTNEPDLHIMIGDRCLRPISHDQGRYVFLLPNGAQAVELVSRSAVPTAARPWIGDRRRLGVMIGRITLRGSDGSVAPLPLDHPGLGAGWWDAEWHDAATLRRWTDGRAVLPVGEGMAVLEVEVSATLDYAIAEAPLRLAA
jgi:hypothetical protein